MILIWWQQCNANYNDDKKNENIDNESIDNGGGDGYGEGFDDGRCSLMVMMVMMVATGQACPAGEATCSKQTSGESWGFQRPYILFCL